MSRLPKQYASYKSLEKKDDKPVYNCTFIKDGQHKQQILENNYLVCVYLYADWCEPCKTIAPLFVNLAQQYDDHGHNQGGKGKGKGKGGRGRCILVKENTDLNLTDKQLFTGIPAFIFYVNGKLLYNKDGSLATVIGGKMEEVKKILDAFRQGN
jgi:thiol-disulfide isomerase/thioredoxin